MQVALQDIGQLTYLLGPPGGATLIAACSLAPGRAAVNAHSRRRILSAAIVGVLTATFLALVVLSPFALRDLTGSFGLDWSSLSDVGQTYGAVSALITALALGGVVISLLYQARDVSTARSQATRTFHHELLRMELDAEDYMWASGAPWGLAVPANYGDLRLHVYVHMWVSFWESQFIIGEMPVEIVRSSVKELFAGQAGRDYWLRVGQHRLDLATGQRLKFAHILDGAYKEAIKDPVAAPEGTRSLQNRPERPKASYYKTVLPCAAAAAAAAGLVARRMAHNSAHRAS